MFYDIIKEQTPVASTNYPGKLSGSVIDKILIDYRADDNANGLSLAEAAAVEVTASHKRFDREVRPIDSFLKDLGNYTNGLGGIGIVNGANCITRLIALLDVGTLDTRNGQDLIVNVKFGACSTLTNAVLNVQGIRTHGLVKPQKSYESFTSAGDVNVKKAVELYLTSAAAGVTAVINDGVNVISVYDHVALALSMALGQYEAVVDFATMWIDPTAIGRDVNVKIAANKTMFAVKYID